MKDTKPTFKLFTFEEFANEDVVGGASLNPGMTVPGMGKVSLPGAPDGPLSLQKPGSGDSPMYIPPEEEPVKKKKKKKKKKKSEL